MKRLTTLAFLFALIAVGLASHPANAQGGIYRRGGEPLFYGGRQPYPPPGFPGYPPTYYPPPMRMNTYGFDRAPVYYPPPRFVHQPRLQFAEAPTYQPSPVEFSPTTSTGQQPLDLQEEANNDYAVPSTADAFLRATAAPESEKWIDVDLTAQRVTAYEGQTPVFEATVSTGTARYPTVVGTYNIYVKYDSARMRGGYGFDAYDLPNVPYVMYFYEGYGLHGTYWHNNFGTPMSHGCVNLSVEDAEWLYEWASVGTKVVTHY